MNKLKNKLIDISISRFSKKGNGLASYSTADGSQKVVEVPFTMPGDAARVKIITKRAGRLKALLTQINEPAPDRRTSKCCHFGLCGGCRWQHMPYSLQLEEKMAFIQTLFPNSSSLRPIIPCKSPWHYRNKMEFSFSGDSSNNRYLGLFIDSSRGKVFNVSECPISQTWFAEVLKSVRNWWAESGLYAYRPSKDTGSLRTLTLRQGVKTEDKMAILTVSGNPEYALNHNHLKGFVEAVKEAAPSSDPSIFLIIHQIAQGKPSEFYEIHLSGKEFIHEKLTVFGNEMTFQISPQAFFQPNTLQAEAIYQKALEMADLSENDVVFDLFCGTGTLGLIASKKVKKVVGIEISPEAILDARENAKLNSCPNIEFFTGDVKDVLKKEPLLKPDIVMIDPPRAGLNKKTLEILKDLKAEKIVYISCNPETQKANIDELTAMGYAIGAIQPLDQFPQTIHMENIVLLCRSS